MPQKDGTDHQPAGRGPWPETDGTQAADRILDVSIALEYMYPLKPRGISESIAEPGISISSKAMKKAETGTRKT